MSARAQSPIITIAEPADRGELYLRRAAVLRRYGGVSHMWIVRRTADSNFPHPVKLGGSVYWRVADLERWEAAQEVRP